MWTAPVERVGDVSNGEAPSRACVVCNFLRMLVSGGTNASDHRFQRSETDGLITSANYLLVNTRLHTIDDSPTAAIIVRPCPFNQSIKMVNATLVLPARHRGESMYYSIAGLRL